MKKTLYIIPGWEETTRRRPYQSLAALARKKGYEVIFKNVEWDKPLWPQMFAVPPHAVVFGFSLGAILAWLVAQKSPCRQIILASMTPHTSFKGKDKKALADVVGSRLVNDAIRHLKPSTKAKKKTIMYGALEEEAGDILVPEAQHELTTRYIKEVARLL